MESVSQDPFDWTVDQVVSFFCYSGTTPWSQSTDRPTLPDPTKFEHVIRENLINGEVLLNDVDKDTLRNELDVKALGHRSSVLNAIRYLQRISQKYQQAKFSERSLDLPEGASRFTTQIATSDHTPRLIIQTLNGGAQNRAQSLPWHSSGRIKELSSLPDNLVVNGDSPKPGSANEQTPNPSHNILPGIEISANGNTENRSDKSHRGHSGTQEESAPRLRTNESIHVDSQGRKRRKLDISSGIAQLSTSHEESSFQPLSGNKTWYMGPQKMNTEDIFYPLLPDPELLESAFTILAPQFPKAQRQFAYQCLRHFFRQRPVDLGIQNGCYNQAIIPSKLLITENGCPRSFTLFSTRGDRVRVTRENSDRWNEFSTQTARPRTISKDSYDALLERYPVTEHEDDLLPLFGESGSEGEYDSDTMREIEEEKLDPVQSRYLTHHEVETTIEGIVTEFRRQWTDNQLPKQQRKARHIWLEARSKRDTYQRIKAILHDIELLEKRLKRLHCDISLNDYTSEAELRVQCQSMEQTIYNVESQKWRVTVLEQEKCPPKVLGPPKTLRPKKLPQNLSEESLVSESESASDVSMGDFIEHDTDEDSRRSLPKTTSAAANKYFFSENETSGTSSGSDDIISPSGRRGKQRIGHGLPVPQVEIPVRRNGNSSFSSPKFVWLGEQEVECVDLTKTNVDSFSDDQLSDESDITPPLNPSKPPRHEDGHASSEPRLSGKSPPLLVEKPPRKIGKNTTMPRATRLNQRLDSPTVSDDSSIPWHVLEERKDGYGILARLLTGMPQDELKDMASTVQKWSDEELKAHMELGLQDLLRKRKEKRRNFSDSDMNIILRICSLYISCINARKFQQFIGIEKGCVEKALTLLGKCFIKFSGVLRNHLNGIPKGSPQTLGHHLSHSRSASILTQQTTKSGVSTGLASTPHKKRKREVGERQEVKVNHDIARSRMQLQEAQRSAVEKRLERLGVSNDDPSRQAISFSTPIVYLNSHVGGRVKPHQLDGIRFMWRELIQNDKKEGCLLAHTMGLGKTMQVVSLLVTIAATAASSDESISSQVPAGFHRSQTLIVCPPSLIENWYEEFLMWTPKENYLGPIRKVTSTDSLQERLAEVSEWNKGGGVLILSYDLFRTWVHNKENQRGIKPLPENTHTRIREQLLTGPNIVVADEAHKLNNRSALISAATREFRTKSRIALTGSPLVNNLENYFAMIDWIAPGYLGSFLEFKANYVEPIEEGSYVDSSHFERRRSLKKRQVLSDILGPKVHRADISVLEGELPPKVEFVITLPLTDLQTKVYNQYVESVSSGGTEGNAQIWSYIDMLSLCCHHPLCFYERVTGTINGGPKPVKKVENVSIDEMSMEETPPTNTSISEALIAKQKELFATVPNFRDLGNSHRMQILNEIIRESLEAGDKVLVFSQRIPTLDYIESFLKDSGIGYSRLDGSTPMATRQAATKNFNKSDNAHQVYLISTKAGGLGLNIPGANRVVIFDFSFSPMWEEQAVGRAYRIGQQKGVFVYRFIAGGTFEDTIHNKAVFKTQLASRVVDRKNPIRLAARNLKEYLFPVKPIQPREDLSEFVGRDPLVLDKIINGEDGMLIRGITFSETFHKDDNDKLTEEEKRDVQQELDDERLKRSDPEAYERKMREKYPVGKPFQPSGLDFSALAYPGLQTAESRLYSFYPHPHNLAVPQPNVAMEQHLSPGPNQGLYQSVGYDQPSLPANPQRNALNQTARDESPTALNTITTQPSVLTLLTGVEQEQSSRGTAINQVKDNDIPPQEQSSQAQSAEVRPMAEANGVLRTEYPDSKMSTEVTAQPSATLVSFPQTDGPAIDQEQPIEISD